MARFGRFPLVVGILAAGWIAACHGTLASGERVADESDVTGAADALDAGASDEDASALEAPAPAEGRTRDVLATALDIDVTARTAEASIRVAGSSEPGLSFEIGDLDVRAVKLGDRTLNFAVVDDPDAPEPTWKRRLDIGVPPGTEPVVISITYAFRAHDAFDGWSPSTNLSFLWPYFCSNLFPCHSDPSDGASFALNVRGVPAGQVAVYPTSLPFDAPSYMPAIAIGDFRYTTLGTTSHGTEVGYYALPPEVGGGVVEATSKLVAIFDWLETTIGPYKFGDKVAAVDAKWGPGAYGGMEHHPYFHVASGAFGDENVHAHESAHAWFGDAVRLRCWEDFVLSEGTATYLAARGTEAVRGASAGEAVWADYRSRLRASVASKDTVAWPQTCNKIDILHDPLWSTIPYMKGAFFYRKVAASIGVSKLDGILAKFYATYQGTAAGMGDMLAMIREESGFDPAALADKYLRSLGNPEP